MTSISEKHLASMQSVSDPLTGQRFHVGSAIPSYYRELSPKSNKIIVGYRIAQACMATTSMS
jgi:hypothetical protein